MEGELQKNKPARRRKNESAGQPEKRKDSVTRTGKQGRKRFEIDIFRDWCKCCGICAAFCPRECIALDEEGAPTMVESNRCTGCGWCEVHCPDFAISVHHRDGEQ
jgi:2-oxoglutarate ferredoxin oxidoreductase subunit delta